ncbi:iron permease FTR1 [Flagelloscypha sp. PMI_526]|nr:iron permease FTR1 [Flagelloscypha sp. PMI_526]
MGKNLFSIPIFFIVFRETLEAAIIISTLLGLVEQLARPKAEANEHGLFVHDWKHPNRLESETTEHDQQQTESAVDENAADPKLLRKFRIQIALGAALGLLLALIIGAAFLAVWFTQASNLWAKTEELWEGIFSLVASLIILIMGLTMLKLDRARVKWRVKLAHAFEKHSQAGRGGKAGRFVLVGLPFITVLREGLEAIVFVGGVSLGQSATSIPIAAICGILAGLVCGFLIYAFASRATIRTFLIAMTCFILLIGAGLFSSAVGFLQRHAFTTLVGGEVDDTGGDGPGSYDVRGVVWHLDCCNPENKYDGDGWMIFAGLFGWTNTATVGTVLAYIFYWLFVLSMLVFMKYREGRLKLFGKKSKAWRRRDAAKAQKAEETRAAEEVEKEDSTSSAAHE